MNLSLPNCDVTYYKNVFTNKESYQYYQYLMNLPYWEIKEIIVANRKCKQNRLTCFFATNNKHNYHYSGTNNIGHIFTPELLEIKKKVESVLNNKYSFNYCLLNYYEDGTQNIGMHSDDEKDLEFPVIASVSLGTERYFDLHNKYNKTIKSRINLENGSIIVMDGTTQKYYKHGVPVQKGTKTGRINLTFRVVKTNKNQGKHKIINNKPNYTIIKTIMFKKNHNKL